MPIKAAKFVCSLVLMLLLLDVIGAVVTSCPLKSDNINSFHPKKPSSSVFDAFLFENGFEETEKTEDEEAGAHRALLVDFSCVARTLSTQFIPKVNLSPFAFHYDVAPPVYTLNCVFII